MLAKWRRLTAQNFNRDENKSSWEEYLSKQVEAAKGHSGANFKGFETMEEAKAFLAEYGVIKVHKGPPETTGETVDSSSNLSINLSIRSIRWRGGNKGICKCGRSASYRTDPLQPRTPSIYPSFSTTSAKPSLDYQELFLQTQGLTFLSGLVIFTAY